MAMQLTLVEQVYVQMTNELYRLEGDLAQCEEIKSLAMLNRIAELRKQVSELADLLPTN